MKKKTYETDLPEGYRLVKKLDINNKKLNAIISIGSILLAAAVLIPLVVILINRYQEIDIYSGWMLLIMCIYFILHELTHSIVYYTLTRQKLAFGISLNSLYCGLPNVYTYRETSLLSMLAPFVLFTIIYLAAIFAIPDPNWKLTLVFDFGIHIGGCIGDLYGASLFFFKYKDPSVLLKDTGPVQEYYAKS
jgi:hypothetical protein